MRLTRTCRAGSGAGGVVLWLVMAAVGWGQGSITAADEGAASRDLASCRVHRVTDLPGSHEFGSDFIEAIASDPAVRAAEPDAIWGLTADLSEAVPAGERAMYISKSVDGGATWKQVARVGSQYFDAKIGEGLRNGFFVAPGGGYFLLTTQRGAFEVRPGAGAQAAEVRAIVGPRVPDTPAKIPIVKQPGDPVRANVVEMTEDGRSLIVGYGYFDREPRIFTYRRGADGGWKQEAELPRIPTEMDLLSIDFDDARLAEPGFLYVGTGDQVYLLNLRAKTWSMVEGVGPDSAIHGMSVQNGLHLAACWGIYEPTGPGTVRRVTEAQFLIHRSTDETGSNVRAYSIDVDPTDPRREVVTALTGVYVTADGGGVWSRVNDLPEEEFRVARFNPDGSVLVSGVAGTFLVNPFSEECRPRLKRRPLRGVYTPSGGAPDGRE